MRHRENGFSAVELVLVLVFAGLLVVGGVVLYKRSKDGGVYKAGTSAVKRTPQPTRTATDASKDVGSIASKVPASPFVNVIQPDDTVTQTTPDKIAKTADQADILTALHNTCTGSANYVTVNHVVFDAGSTTFAQDGTYASINAGVCNEQATSLDDVGGVSARRYLHAAANAWVLDASTQADGPECAKVDGLGYPKSIIALCYDGGTTRAPK